MKIFAAVSCFVLLCAGQVALAGEADVIKVVIKPLSSGQYAISTTLKHADTGWKHYADAWDVLDESGNVLGTRVLHHPHVNEQPFTRSLTLKIPAKVKQITIRAHDSVHKYGGKTVTVDVPRVK